MIQVDDKTKLHLAGAILYGQTTHRDRELERITGLRMTDRPEKWKAALADAVLRGDAELYDELLLPVKAMPSLDERYANLPQNVVMGKLRAALRAARHELTTLHGLLAADAEEPQTTWTIDTSVAKEAIDEALNEASCTNSQPS